MTGLFIDASALVAILSVEPEMDRVSAAIASADEPFTTAIVVLEVTLALARSDKWNLSVDRVEPAVTDYLEDRGIELRELPLANRSVQLAISAATRYRQGRRGLNICDCLHYATAKFYDAAVLATANEFRATDLEVAP
jgi:ribonuclease VapC